MHQRKRTVARGFRALQFRRQRLEVIDLTFGQFRNHIQPAETFQLAREVIRQVSKEMFGLTARLFGCDARLLRLALGAMGTLVTDIGQNRGGERADGERRTHDGDLPRTHQRAACCEFALALLGEQPLGGIARLALVAQIAAAAHDAAEHVVREFDAADVKALFDPQQTAVDQHRERIGGGAGGCEAAQQALLGDVFAKTGGGEQLILDDVAYGRRLVGE